MNRTEEQLRQLAERGPFIDRRIVVRHAMNEATAATPRIQHRRAARVLTVAAGLAAAATAVYVGTGDQPREPLQPAATAAEDSTTSAPPVSPADATLSAMYLSLLDVPTADEMVTFLSFNVPEQDLATCMQGAGFQYMQRATPAQQVAADPRYSLSPADYASTYGFGVSAYEVDSDPNATYVASLTQTQQDSYVQQIKSCATSSERVKYSAALNAALRQFRPLLGADERVLSAKAAWTSCMAAAGYDYADRQAMLDSLYARLAADSSADALRRLHDDEVALAVAEVPCYVAYKTAYREVAAERFGEFRDLFNAAMA